MSRYKRAPSEALQTALAGGGFLSSLLEQRVVAGLPLDVHFRENDHVHAYCGLTRVIDVCFRRNWVDITAHNTYRKQPHGAALFRRWQQDEPGFKQALDQYFANVAVDRRHVASEGAVQAQWSRIAYPWMPIDREAVIGYTGVPPRSFAAVNAAWSEVEKLAGDAKAWTLRKPHLISAELDQIAVDPEGRLVLIELKHAAASAGSVYFSPMQLLQYTHEWAASITRLQKDLERLCEARRSLGLAGEDFPGLSGLLRPVIAFGDDLRSREVSRRFEQVRAVANRYLPPGVSPIEVWCMKEGRPAQLAS